MNLRNGLLGAACVILALGSTAMADNTIASTANGAPAIYSAPDFSPTQLGLPVFADDATTEKPLMQGLDAIGIGKPLESFGIDIYGYVEVGYFYDLTSPRDTTPAKAPPGDFIYFPGGYKNSFLLDQVDLSIEKKVDGSKWDVGGKIEGIYGRDAFYTHSDGILDNGNKHGDSGPDDQLDLEQAYLTVGIPLGGGLIIEAGKFATLMGEETINPTTNLLYTHSYEFAYGIPFTQTGILATYKVIQDLSLTAGITRGWNQSSDDNNGAIDFLGQAVLTISDFSLTGNVSVGPESPHDNSDYWFVPELILSDKLSDQLTISGDALYGLASSISQWYAIAGYGSYQFTKQFMLNGRAEFYHDGHGVTTGAASGGHDVNFAEGTVGLQIVPFPSDAILQYLQFRPELRFDAADHRVFDGHNSTELTAAIDAIMQF